MYVLVQKLKILKKALVMLNKQRVGNVVNKEELARDDMFRAQIRLQADPLNTMLI